MVPDSSLQISSHSEQDGGDGNNGAYLKFSANSMGSQINPVVHLFTNDFEGASADATFVAALDMCAVPLKASGAAVRQTNQRPRCNTDKVLLNMTIP